MRGVTISGFFAVFLRIPVSMDEGERLKREKQREARRRNILSNASSRMEKLKNMGKRYDIENGRYF